MEPVLKIPLARVRILLMDYNPLGAESGRQSARRLRLAVFLVDPRRALLYFFCIAVFSFFFRASTNV